MFGAHSVDDEKRAARFEALLELVRGAGSPVPSSALKARREAMGLSQHELAQASGVSQPTISRVEAGTATLPSEVASRLDTALKTNVAAGELPLHVLEILSGLKRAASQGELSPTKMLRAASLVAEVEATAEGMQATIDAAVSAMLDVAVIAAETWEGEAALKTRDRRGRRVDKPFGSSKREDEPEGPRRDLRGRRVDKPHDPRRVKRPSKT